MTDSREINIKVVDKSPHRPIISRPTFIILILGIIMVIATVGISGFIALKLRIAQKSEARLPSGADAGMLTEEQKQRLLNQLSAEGDSSNSSDLTDAQKMDLLKDLAKPTVGAKKLTDKEKQEILQSLSVPSK